MLTGVVSTFGACQVFLVMVLAPLLGWHTGTGAGPGDMTARRGGGEFSVP